ncbi:hypothetical protein V4R08_15390 [Nitrobacter sp. NHB1]|uniref:hypothetical protein n=1 Tax=Nitrobacter sp. NHB1 TaxID=3119830 RepID=UPI00300068ED
MPGAAGLHSWLARKDVLPAETEGYVRKITGSPTQSWALESKTLKLTQQLPRQAPCEGAGGLSHTQTTVAVSVSLAPAISSIVRKAEQEAAAAAAAAKAAAKAVAAANEKLRTALGTRKTHKSAM